MYFNTDNDFEILFSSFPSPEEFYFLLIPGTRKVKKVYVNNNAEGLEYCHVYVDNKPKGLCDTEIPAKDILKDAKKEIALGKALGKSVDNKFVIKAIERVVFQMSAQLCGGKVSGVN